MAWKKCCRVFSCCVFCALFFFLKKIHWVVCFFLIALLLPEAFMCTLLSYGAIWRLHFPVLNLIQSNVLLFQCHVHVNGITPAIGNKNLLTWAETLKTNLLDCFGCSSFLDFSNKEMKCSRDNPVWNSSDLLAAISKHFASSLLLPDTLCHQNQKFSFVSFHV